MKLTIETKANGALFNTEPEGRNPNGPVMTGTLDVADQKVRVAAFLKARPKVMRWIDYVFAGVMGAFAVRLVTARL